MSRYVSCFWFMYENPEDFKINSVLLFEKFYPHWLMYSSRLEQKINMLCFEVDLSSSVCAE